MLAGGRGWLLHVQGVRSYRCAAALQHIKLVKGHIYTTQNCGVSKYQLLQFRVASLPHATVGFGILFFSRNPPGGLLSCSQAQKC